MHKQTTRQYLVEALEFARVSNPVAAVASLERGLKEARSTKDKDSISLLAKNAGIISLNSGDSNRAASYFEEALSSEPSDAYLYIMIADVYKQQGNEDKSKQAIITCLKMAKDQGDEELLAILQEKMRS